MLNAKPKNPSLSAKREHRLPSAVPETAGTRVGPDAQVTNPARVCAFYFALAFVFVRFSFVHEAIDAVFGVKTYLLYLFGPPALAGLILTGGLRRCFRMRCWWLTAGFALWLTLATPFRSWPGGSFQFTTGFLKTELPILFLIAGLAVTWKECVLVASTIAVAGLFNLLLCRFLSIQIDGRLSLGIPTSISNSNDLAAHLILTL